VLLQPRLDVLTLSTENDALPGHLSSTWIILAHYVRILIQYQHGTVRLETRELEG
jgi:hypothetical protein